MNDFLNFSDASAMEIGAMEIGAMEATIEWMISVSTQLTSKQLFFFF